MSGALFGWLIGTVVALLILFACMAFSFTPPLAACVVLGWFCSLVGFYIGDEVWG